MNKSLSQSVILVLFVSILANAFGWAFNGEVFNHELDHDHHAFSLNPIALLDAHEHEVSNDADHPDAAINLCLHAAGQYQPFFFTPPLIVPPLTVVGVLVIFILSIIPDSILDSPLHPPRNTFPA
ncbi:MAG: hypothetical protein ABS69_19235 [Nitrosomonadales bacterium SCN 54-20]|nr:MAG: hypothetical protein ABS69_19235 [Nitrosomonadales bacterium SCN 54-20]